MKEKNTQKKDTAPVVWAVGGGKGGVGKSVISTLLAFWLVRMGKRTVLVDVDLGGANLHTLLGIKSPERTLNDFVTKRYGSLEDICIPTPEKKLRLISGASEILSLSNPHFSQKVKIIKNIFRLDADYVILDLGAGTSFNVLDFFLFAHRRIIVVTPQPISIQNAYGFIRNAVYRRLSQVCSQKPTLQILVKTAMDPKNDLKVRTIKELFSVIQESGDFETAETLKNEIARIRPAVITNMVRDPKEKNAGRIVQLVAEKYLMLNPVDYGSIAYDKQIYSMVSGMVPLTELSQSSDALACAYEIATRLL